MASMVFDLLFNSNPYYNNNNKYEKIKQTNSNSNNNSNNIPIDINETSGQFIIDIELPGVYKDNIKIFIKDYIVHIKINKQQQNNKLKNSTNSNNSNTNTTNYNIVSERKFGIFKRRIDLNPVINKIDLNSITSNLINGLLVIKINKLDKIKTIDKNNNNNNNNNNVVSIYSYFN